MSATVGARARRDHGAEALGQASDLGGREALDGFGHQIGRSDADRAAARLETRLRNAAIGQPDAHLDAVAAHRVVALGGAIERIEPALVARVAAVVEDHLLIQVTQIGENLAHAKNARTRSSVSASTSISPCVV